MKRIHMLGPDAVTVTESFILDSFRLEESYLLSLEPQRLLAGFRQTAGFSPQAERYGGWESTEIQGHTMGHYLTSLAQSWAVSHNPKIMERIVFTIDGLKECQREDGFLFASPEELFDRVENRQPVWVPWYTMHKIVAGLVSVCRLTNLDVAHDVLRQLCGWICSRALNWDEETHRTVLAVEYGGMNDCLYDAYEIIGDDKILQAAHQFDELPLFTAMAEGRDILNGLHANTTIPKILGGLKRYAVVEDCEPLYLDMAENFWDMVISHHTYLSGGNSEWEHFGLPDVLDAERTACNCETCNTHNMIKLSQLLFELTGKKKYAEYDAWAYVNTILSSQNHETGMTTYFQPMDTGYFKVYSRPFDQFWCCTGTGMENFSNTWSGIACRQDSTLYINRLIGCEINTDGLSARINSDWTQGCITIEVNCSSPDRSIALRIPHWAANFSVQLPDGISCTNADGYLTFRGFGTEECTIMVNYTMELRRHGLPDSNNTVAYSYGPFMLSADMGCAQMDTGITGVDVTVPTRSISMRDHLIDPNILPTGSPCEFKLVSADGYELPLAPHFLKNQVRYGIYFREFSEGSDQLAEYLAEQKHLQSIMMQHDVIPVGNDQYELAHHVRGEKTDSFTDETKRGRIVHPGGYISYTMNAPSDPCLLCFSYEGTASVTLNGIAVSSENTIHISDELRGGEITLVIFNTDADHDLWLYGEIYITGEQEHE